MYIPAYKTMESVLYAYLITASEGTSSYKYIYRTIGLLWVECTRGFSVGSPHKPIYFRVASLALDNRIIHQAPREVTLTGMGNIDRYLPW